MDSVNIRSAHTGHHLTGYLLDSSLKAWSGLPATELTTGCVEESLSAICSTINYEVHPSAIARRWSPTSPKARSIRSTTNSCVWHSISFMTLAHLPASSTIGRVPRRLEIGVVDVHSTWRAKLRLHWYSCSRFHSWEWRQQHR